MKILDKDVNKNHATVTQTLYFFEAKSQKRLLKASKLMRYYEMKQQTQHVVPKITGELPVMQWMDVFDDFFHRKIGVRTIPLSYMTRATILASKPASDHEDDLPHGKEFDFIKEELVAQTSHMHPLYHEDNAAVYYCLGEAVQGTQYALSLKPYQQ
eukprot:10839515-Ditylum_brightwellii.AAC.1